MKRLSLKEAFSIATIHDALRELRIRGEMAVVQMYSETISIKAYPETVEEARKLKKIFCCFKDEKDVIETQYFPPSDESTDFYKVELRKWLV